jgi:hypothetical protein
MVKIFKNNAFRREVSLAVLSLRFDTVQNYI